MTNPRSNDKTLTQARLQEKLCYDAATGIFTRRAVQGLARRGMVVGRRFHDNGCVFITVCGGRYPAQLLAWLYVYGMFPQQEIVFKDGVRHNVAIENLALGSAR